MKRWGILVLLAIRGEEVNWGSNESFLSERLFDVNDIQGVLTAPSPDGSRSGFGSSVYQTGKKVEVAYRSRGQSKLTSSLVRSIISTIFITPPSLISWK
jgi:hypothetical protein